MSEIRNAFVVIAPILASFAVGVILGFTARDPHDNYVRGQHDGVCLALDAVNMARPDVIISEEGKLMCAEQFLKDRGK